MAISGLTPDKCRLALARDWGGRLSGIFTLLTGYRMLTRRTVTIIMCIEGGKAVGTLSATVFAEK